MNLLKAAERKCVILQRQRIPTPAGSEVSNWTDGAEFVNRPALNFSKEGRKAEKPEPDGEYKGLIDADVALHYGDIFRDTVSGETFRVTSRPEDKQAPPCASPLLRGKKYLNGYLHSVAIKPYVLP